MPQLLELAERLTHKQDENNVTAQGCRCSNYVSSQLMLTIRDSTLGQSALTLSLHILQDAADNDTLSSL